MSTVDYESMSDRELDALVVERVFGARWRDWERVAGWRVLSLPGNANDVVLARNSEGALSYGIIVSNYASDWRAMQQVVERMAALGWTWEIGLDVEGVVAVFSRPARHDDEAYAAVHASAPRAVCIAALQAAAAPPTIYTDSPVAALSAPRGES